ncbi:MAG: hypothetical protein LLG05_03535 [Porphyromonadaceae bacterium]|nr:hypothetical protein [Porphyromonadaceae bacterium]
MKRLCLILAFLFLFSQTAFAMPLLIGQKVVYRGTVTGLRISAVDGTAFIDNLPYTYQSDFSAGVDGWGAARGTVAGNIDGIGGEDNTIRYTVDTSSNLHYLFKASTFTINRKYNVTFKYYIPSGQSNVDSLILQNDTWGGTTTTLTTTDSWTIVTKTFTANNTTFWVYAADGGATTFQDAGGDDVFYIKDITISEITPYMDGNHQIEIYDASNRMLRGVLKAAGSGEGLGDEKIDTWTNNGYDTLTLSGSDILSAVDAGTDNITVTQNIALISGGIYKFVLNLTVASGSSPMFVSCAGNKGLSTASASFSKNPVSSGTYYYTANSNTFHGFRNGGGDANWSASGISLKQVTAPSALGATIVSAKGGETYNWAYKNSSFVFNASSYYCIIKSLR